MRQIGFAHLSGLLLAAFANCARLSPQVHLQGLQHDFESVTSDLAPPLEGCQQNYWDNHCCCFIQAGILEQRQCMCMESKSSCEKHMRITYSKKPSRPIPGLTDHNGSLKWFDPAMGGYLSGFQDVEDEFCLAAPVEHAQVDPFERSFTCTCTTAMGHNTDMDCGSSCGVDTCQKSNPAIFDWSPFRAGRGRCCKSSYSSQVEGCPQEVAPITESLAKTIVTDAIAHVAKGNKAFMVKTSEGMIVDMTNSFSGAKELKMSTSRSGAQFFFSGDYNYILKSINPSEYDVLAKISKKPLIDHLALFRNHEAALQTGGGENCVTVWIASNAHSTTSDSPEIRLAKFAAKLSSFFGYWYYDEERSLLSGQTIYAHQYKNYIAYWCPLADEFRIQGSGLESLDFSECEHREKDPFFHLLGISKTSEHTDEHVASVYNDFIAAFKTKASAELSFGTVTCKCTEYWQPASLINDFLIGFKYKASTWMVVKNSVNTVKKELEIKGFTQFYQENDLFDVKPFPIHSDQRPMLFKMHFTKASMASWTNWHGVRRNLGLDLRFMDTALDNEMVDYSILVSAFYINDERLALDHATLPNCVEKRLSEVRTFAQETGKSDYGDAPGPPGSILVCFSIIDMLMEFTFHKTAENLILLNKWSSWSTKIMTMFDCLGNPNDRKTCPKYTGLRDEYPGVDIPSIKTAGVRDVSSYFTAENEAMVRNPRTNGVFTWKCCCHKAVSKNPAKCVLADVDQKDEWYFGQRLQRVFTGTALNSKGCGSLIDSGWHSYWREAKKCIVTRAEAEFIETNLIQWV